MPQMGLKRALGKQQQKGWEHNQAAVLSSTQQRGHVLGGAAQRPAPRMACGSQLAPLHDYQSRQQQSFQLSRDGAQGWGRALGGGERGDGCAVPLVQLLALTVQDRVRGALGVLRFSHAVWWRHGLDTVVRPAAS